MRMAVTGLKGQRGEKKRSQPISNSLQKSDRADDMHGGHIAGDGLGKTFPCKSDFRSLLAPRLVSTNDLFLGLTSFSLWSVLSQFGPDPVLFFPLEEKNPVEVSEFCGYEGCRSRMNEEQGPEPKRVPRAYSRITGTTVDHQTTLWCHSCHLQHGRQPGLRKKRKKKGKWLGTDKTNASLSKVSNILLHCFQKNDLFSLPPPFIFFFVLKNPG